jgi:hypothetical protein
LDAFLFTFETTLWHVARAVILSAVHRGEILKVQISKKADKLGKSRLMPKKKDLVCMFASFYSQHNEIESTRETIKKKRLCDPVDDCERRNGRIDRKTGASREGIFEI